MGKLDELRNNKAISHNLAVEGYKESCDLEGIHFPKEVFIILSRIVSNNFLFSDVPALQGSAPYNREMLRVLQCVKKNGSSDDLNKVALVFQQANLKLKDTVDSILFPENAVEYATNKAFVGILYTSGSQEKFDDLMSSLALAIDLIGFDYDYLGINTFNTVDNAISAVRCCLDYIVTAHRVSNLKTYKYWINFINPETFESTDSVYKEAEVKEESENPFEKIAAMADEAYAKVSGKVDSVLDSINDTIDRILSYDNVFDFVMNGGFTESKNPEEDIINNMNGEQHKDENRLFYFELIRDLSNFTSSELDSLHSEKFITGGDSESNISFKCGITDSNDISVYRFSDGTGAIIKSQTGQIVTFLHRDYQIAKLILTVANTLAQMGK